MALTVDDIAAILQDHRAELDALGVASLAVFGSVARGDAREDSDVDVLVEFADDPTLRTFMGVKFLLEAALGHQVDLSTREALRPRLRQRIFAEARRVA